MILWLIGISGAGKTTVGRALIETMRQRGRPTLFIDGDQIRTVWQDDLGHTIEARRRNHSRLSQLCKVLDQDGVDIVVSALSIFADLREWNRRNLRYYLEVHLDLPVEEARQRDPKGIYARRERGEAADVVGIDIPFPVSTTTDLRIGLPEILDPPEAIAGRIMELIENSEAAVPAEAGAPYRYAGRDLFEAPETYEFAPCQEHAFFAGWQDHRRQAMAAYLQRAGRDAPPPLEDLVGTPSAADDDALQAIMSRLYHAAERGRPDSDAYRDAKRVMDEFVKKFEIFRRLFERYDTGWRRAEGAEVAGVNGYCAFGAALVAFHRRSGVPIYSSTLLKLLDAILSRGANTLSLAEAGRVAALLQAEGDAVRYWERHTDSMMAAIAEGGGT